MGSLLFYIRISQLSVVIPLISGLIFFKKLDKPFKLLFAFICFSALIEIGSSVMVHLYNNNMPLLHLYIFFEFCIFMYIIHLFFKEKKMLSKVILISLIVFVLTAIADAVFLDGIWKFNLYAHSLESMILVAFSLAYYYLFYKENQEMLVWRQPMFWFITGIFFYFSLNFFFFLLQKFLLIQNPSTSTIPTFIHAMTNIITNILFAISFRCFRRATN